MTDNDILQHTSSSVLSMPLMLQNRIQQDDALTFKIRGDLVSFLLRFLLSLKELADGLTGKAELHLQGYTPRADTLQR